jgi:hypothetical protein
MALLVQFLTQVRAHVRSASGDQLRAWLQVEPSAPQPYHDLAAELRTQFRRSGTASAPSSLDATIEKCLPEDDDVPDGGATPWPGFVAFMREYLLFWRDVNPGDLLDAHERLSGLVNTCSTAFAHPMYGSLLLQTSMSLSESLCRLTMILNKRPDLMSRKRRRADDENRKSVAETSAEIVQKIFTTCLTDRSSGRYSKPEGKKVGVYMFANLVLKLLFACRRTHLAKQIFTNISTNSPPLSLYPASQRVTFLYYLGRFHLSNNHFLWAARCLEGAYLQTPRAFVSHRTNILTYLIPANMLLGRLPSRQLLSRPEAAQTLAPVYAPIAHAVRTGNFVLLQHTLATHQAWLLEKALLLALTYRLRPLLWRALSRKTFILTYVPDADASSRKAATLELGHLLTVATHVQRRLEGWVPSNPSFSSGGRPPVFLQAVHNTNHPDSSSFDSTLAPPPGGPKKLSPNEGLVCGNLAVTASTVESTVASLIHQGLMHGFIAHAQQRFAIMGAKQKGSPVLAGWPEVWTAISERRYDEDIDWHTIPGWVKA